MTRYLNRLFYQWILPTCISALLLMATASLTVIKLAEVAENHGAPHSHRFDADSCSIHDRTPQGHSRVAESDHSLASR